MVFHKLVVGSANFGSFNGHAAFWREDLGLVDLKTYLIGLGVQGLNGWDLQSATGASFDGNVIVGYGSNPLGRIEGFYVTIPSPGAPRKTAWP